MKYGRPMPKVGNRLEADEQVRHLEGKEAALERQANREHQRQRDEEDQPFLTAAQPQMAGAGHHPRRET